MRTHGTWRMPQPRITQGCASARGMGQQSALEHRVWEGAGGAKVAWTASGWTRDPASRAGAGARHDPSLKQARDYGNTLQPGATLELHACQAGLSSCITAGMDEPGAGPGALRPGQGPAVCHRPPPYRNGIRDFSKLVITSVFLSWIHLSCLITEMHRGSNSCPTLLFFSVSLSLHLTLSFFYTRQKDMLLVH